MVLRRVVCIPKRRQNTSSITAEIPTKFCSTIKTGSILIVSFAPGAVGYLRPVFLCNGGHNEFIVAESNDVIVDEAAHAAGKISVV